MLVHEFRSEWPNQSLLSNDDVEVMRHVSTFLGYSLHTGLHSRARCVSIYAQVIRMTIDTALATAERESHVGDIYDMNATAYTIWLIQHTYARRNGGWTAVSEQQQRQWSFESLYRWLEVQHARGVMRYLYDSSTRQLLHRYKLPFKPNMRIPPAKTERFKWVRGAKRLSDWIESAGLEPFDPAIQNQMPPALVAPPPLQSQREERRAAMWSRIASRGSRTRHIANEDSEDARLTRDVVQSVMSASRASTARASSEPSADGGDDSDSEEAWVRELEREMEQGDTADGDDLPLNASRGAAAGASSEPPSDGGDDSDKAWVRELEIEMEQGVTRGGER